MNRIAIACLFITAGFTYADNWPQWRGAHHDGISAEKNLPTAWSESKNVLWKLPMPGMGCSTPCVWGDKLFVTSEDGGDVVLICVSTSGKELWKKPIGKATGKARNDEGNGATASPSTDGKHVWAFAGSGELSCHDFDGNKVWSFNVQERYGKFRIQFGMHSTPTLHDGKLYMQTLHTAGQWVFAVDAATGKELWKIDRAADTPDNWESAHGYASTILWKNAGKELLIVHGNDYATGHELKDGKEVWRVGDLNATGRRDWRFVASVGISPDLIVIPTCKNGVTAAIRPDVTGTVKAGGSGEVWRIKYTTDVPTPVIHDGLVYMLRAEGQNVCLDAKTGKELYNERGYNSRHRASPILADGKLYCTARNGTFSVIAAGKEYKLLSRHKLDDEFAASPAMADGRIYLRGFKSLYCIGNK